jgi:hypothetical protein
MMTRITNLRALLVPLLLSLLALTGPGGQALAQPDDLQWATPANLSHGGAAASPLIVVVPDGRLRILWWDELDGLMVASGTVASLQTPGTAQGESAADGGWSAPAQAPILLPSRLTGATDNVPTPLDTMPLLVADAEGRAHAFWPGEPNQRTGARSLLHSYLAPGSTSWSSPQSVVDSGAGFAAAGDLSGAVHVAYVQPEGVGNSPAGMYYRRSRGGAEWSTPVLIQQSRYLRFIPIGGDALNLTADDSENLYVTWEDPRSEQVLMADSHNGGASWAEPRPVAPSDDLPLNNRVIALPGRPAGVVWELAGEEQGQIAASSSGDALMLTVWNGVRWSDARRRALYFQDPELGERVRLSDLRLALAPISPRQAEAGQILIVVGVDQTQDLRITAIQTVALEELFRLPQETPLPQPAGDQGGAGPANLSQSGAASSPAVVAEPDGRLRVFWSDEFDGLMVADGILLATPVLSGTQELMTTQDSWSEPRTVPLAATSMPEILADAAGGIHAFWLQESIQDGSEEGWVQDWPLLYSQLASDTTTWLPSMALAESAASYDVATDASGAFYLAYIRAVDTPSFPAGIYFRRMAEEDGRWTAPVALAQSRYLRLLSREAAHVSLAAAETGELYVTWDDPRTGELQLAYSPDGGQTWEGPDSLDNPEAQPRWGQLLAVPGGEVLLLWQDVRSGGACNLYQAPAASLLGDAAVPAQRVLEELVACPDNADFLALDEGQVLMIAGGGGDSLTVAIWDGEQWSQPSRVGYSFENLETGGQVYLSNLQAALVSLPAPSPEGGNDPALVAVGTDQDGDVWASSSQLGTLDIVFAPPSPWSVPVSLTDSEGAPELPAMANDAEGRLHVLWGEDTEGPTAGASLLYVRQDQVATASGTEMRWTSPTEILASPDGGADQPSLIALGNQLHAVWRGGQDGEVFYSQAFATDAYIASVWTEPQRLAPPGTMVSWPHIAADLGGNLHVVYAVPVNEGRGIYYTRSNDGVQWSAPRQVFDAARAGWAMSDYPRVAVDLGGTIHVVWTRADPLGSGLTRAIYYARSVDGGVTWSEALEVAAGASAWPQVTVSVTGEIHLVWTDTGEENACWHQWSADGGLTWTRPERVPGFESVPGPIGVLADGAGTVSLVGLGQDSGGKPILLYATWDGQRWGEQEVFGLGLAMDSSLPGVSSTLLPSLGHLDVVFRGASTDPDEGAQVRLWYAERAVPAVVATPVPTFTPRPTAMPSPTPVPTTFATPTPGFGTAPPQRPESSMNGLLPLLVPGVLAVLIVVGAFGARVLLAQRRR